MNPILFSESETQFNTNGIGRLSDAISCTVTEERNGKYEMEMVYPYTGQHYEDIRNRSIIAVIPYKDASLQPFRVYKISRPIGGRVTINARHLSYDLNKNTAMPFSVEASTGACAAALQGLKTNAVETCPFSFETDVTTLAGYSQPVPSAIRSRLGGVEGSILDQFGGEYEWDGWRVILHRNRGHDLGVVLRYGKNITDLTQEEIISETITGVVPYWADIEGDQVVTLPERAVYSPYAERYSSHLTIPLDMSGEYEDPPSVETLRAAAEAYITKHDIGVPTVSIRVSFVNLADTLEYKEMESLQSVHLCDTITVQFEKLGIDTTAKVASYRWNVLAERYDEITVGSIRTSLAVAINDQNSSTIQAIDKMKTQTGTAVNKATAWLSSGNGYIVARKGQDGEWKELLAMDAPDIETAEKVMRLNENGLGGSSNGIDGPYEAAILVDGTIVANMVKTGVLTATGAAEGGGTEDKFRLNMETGELFMKDGTFMGTVRGSVIEWGTSGTPAKMYYKQMTDPTATWYQLAIEAQSGETININTKKNNNNQAHIEIQPGAIILYVKENGAAGTVQCSANLNCGNLQVAGTLEATGKIYAKNGHYVPYSFTKDINFSYFESSGKKYLGVYKESTVLGSVELT